jgi:hypothetical protein
VNGFASKISFRFRSAIYRGEDENSDTFDPTNSIPPELNAEITTQTARYFDIFSLKSIWILIQSSK